MNKLFTKLAAGFIGLTMVASVGAVIGSKALEKSPVEANAADTTYTFTSNSWEDSTKSWVCDKKGTATGDARGISVQAGATGAGAHTASIDNISSVSIVFSKSNKGVGNVTVSIGNEEVIKVTSPTTTATTYSSTFEGLKSGSVSFVVTCTTSTLYVQSVTIETSSGKTVSDFYLVDEDAEFIVDNSEIDVVGEGTSASYTVNGEVEYSDLSSDYDYELTATATSGISIGDVEDDGDCVISFTANGTYDIVAVPGGDSDKAIEFTFNVSGITVVIFEKVKSAPSDWSGEYLLVYEKDATTAYAWTGVDAANCYAAATIKDNKIEKPADAISLIFASMKGGYSIEVVGGTNNGKYIYGTSSSNKVNFGNDPSVNTLSINGNSAIITSNTSTMMYNTNSSDNRFRYYKTGSSQQSVQLYKKVEAYSIADFANDWNTATNAACSNPDADNTTAVTAAWPGIKTNYLKLSAADQAKVAAGEEPTPASLLERYDHIIERYGLENFMNRSVTPSPRINVLPTMNDNGSIAIIVIVSLLSVTAIGTYFYIRRRRQHN